MKSHHRIFAMFACLFVLMGFCSTGNGQPKDSKIINKVPSHLPIKIEIINEESNEPLRDLRIKVTNVSNKPVYFLKFFVSTNEDFVSPNGSQYGFPLKYGRPQLIKFSERASIEDIPLKKGDSHIFNIDPTEAKRFNESMSASFRSRPEYYLLEFQFLSFGDGTGFWGSNGKAFPSKTRFTQHGSGNSDFRSGFFLPRLRLDHRVGAPQRTYRI